MQSSWRFLAGGLGFFTVLFIAALLHGAAPKTKAYERGAVLAGLSGLVGPAFSVQSGEYRRLSPHRAGLRPYPALPESSTLGFVLKGRE